jgi:acetoin utilization deacetylase AcuC-like enzyme
MIDVFWHDDVLAHDTGRGLFDAPSDGLLAVDELHPENAERVRNMRSVLQRGPCRSQLRWRAGRHATIDELASLHDRDYIADIEAACVAGQQVTHTTLVAAGSWPPLLAAAGTAIAACDSVLNGETTIAYALVRPPGHHASQRQADGYCFFNNAALAAQRAVSGGVDRVVILDWDVHHGNGTQTIFYDRRDVLTISWHMRHGSWGPSHPETGAPSESGSDAGLGYNVNVELPLGVGDAAYLQAFDEIVTPILDQYQPQLILVASGQDANQFDPNGRQSVTMRGFHQLACRTRQAAQTHSDGRIVAVQEGGYARSYSAMCLSATIDGLLGQELSLADPLAFLPDDPDHADAALAAVRDHHSAYWRFP